MSYRDKKTTHFIQPPQIFAGKMGKKEFRINLDSLKKVYVDVPELLYEDKASLSPSKSFWTQTAFGRTLSGRNQTGRTIRRVGGGVLAAGLGLLGIDLGGVLQPEAGVLPVLEQIEAILIIIGGIVTTIAQMVDKTEITGERLDEREITEGTPLIRKLQR